MGDDLGKPLFQLGFDSNKKEDRLAALLYINDCLSKPVALAMIDKLLETETNEEVRAQALIAQEKINSAI